MAEYYVNKGGCEQPGMVNNKGRIYTQRTPDYGNTERKGCGPHPSDIAAYKAAYKSDPARVDQRNRDNQK